MSELEFRPRFRFRTPLTPDTIKERIHAAAGAAESIGLSVGGTGNHLTLQFPHALQRSWTPQMDIDLELHEDDPGGVRTLVRCQIGPMPSVWMLFVGSYLALCVFALLGLTMGVSQQVVGSFAWGWLVAMPTPFLAFGLWILAQEGKRRSKDEMRFLKTFVDGALGCDCFALAEGV